MTIATYAELQRRFHEVVKYDPETGQLTWVRSGRGRFKRAGAPAGGARPDGYKSVCIDDTQWLVHRVAWVLAYGEEPPRIIDHINRDRSDNRISNLRDGSNGVNEINAKAPKDSPFGISGVRRASKSGHFQAYTHSGGFKSFYHGPDFFEACCARKSWEAKFWGAAA